MTRLESILGAERCSDNTFSAKQLIKLSKMKIDFTYPRDNKEFSKFCTKHGRPIPSEATLACFSMTNSNPLYETRLEDLWERFQDGVKEVVEKPTVEQVMEKQHDVVQDVISLDTRDQLHLDFSRLWKLFDYLE